MADRWGSLAARAPATIVFGVLVLSSGTWAAGSRRSRRRLGAVLADVMPPRSAGMRTDPAAQAVGVGYQAGGAGSTGVIRARAGIWIRSRACPGRFAGSSSRAGTGTPRWNTMRRRAGVAAGATSAGRAPGTTRYSGAGRAWIRALAGIRSRTRTWPRSAWTRSAWTRSAWTRSARGVSTVIE